LEAAKKVHEPLKEGEKDYDVCICRDDRCVLRVDDTDMMINSKFKTRHNNDLIDLSEMKVGFYVDHLYRIPNTRVLVFFPYDIDVAQLSKLSEHCDSHDYKLELIGGESVYGGKSPFTNGTMTVVLMHKGDDYSRVDLLELIGRLNDTDVDDEDDEDGELGEDIIEILRLKKLMQEKKLANENEKLKNMSDEDVMKYWDNK
jgi:hypothetical protein